MTPQDPMLAREPEVDAYVDALLSLPVAEAVATPVAASAPVPAVETGSAFPVPEASPAMTPASAAATRPAPIPDEAPALQLVPAQIRGIAAPAISVADAAEPLPAARAVPSGQRWLRVAIDEDRYAVELLRVQEVVRLVPLIAVRGAAPSLLGVMNLRGRVVPVHDLGKWLRSGQVVPDERARIVVLEHDDELVGVLVTAVTDVVTLDTAQIEPPTPGTRDRTGLGIARTPGAPPTVLLDARVVFG